VICRVDERLIHGQVVLGWANHLRLTDYLVVDDGLAASDWERDLYELAVPASAHADFWSVDDAAERLVDPVETGEGTMILVRDLETTVKLARAEALAGVSVNVGGIHPAPDRKQVLSYVHLSREDLDRIRWLVAHGITVYAQDLPTSTRVDAETLISKGRVAWGL
jgi:mannose/fructose/N-acetylgalactosamine-specific phosphotransferase system component IIB